MTPLVHVELPGHGTFWIEQATLDGVGNSPLAPEEHVTGCELNAEAWEGDSYAHCYSRSNLIMRFGNPIAKISDLKRIP